MKRLLVVCGLLALGAFLAFSLVAAQTAAPAGLQADKLDNSPISPSAIAPRTSHTLVQNMENVTANLRIEYYASDTGQLKKAFDDWLPPNGARTYHASDYPELGANFLGAMVVSSDRQIVAVVVNAGSTSHDIYEGTNEGAVEQFLPSVHWRAGQYTLAGFQNTDPLVTATVAISYFRQDGSMEWSGTRNVPPSAAIHHDARTYGTSPGGVGSIKVTSLTGQKIASSAIETFGDETYSYRAFPPTAGATKIYLPSIHRNPGGHYSFTLVQNMSETTDNQVRINYYNQAGTLVNQFTVNIPAKGAYTFRTNGGPEDPVGLGIAGTAVLESLNVPPLPMVAVVVETVGSFAYAYDGQTDSDAAQSLLFPSMHRNPGGQYSHTLVQNLSNSLDASLVLTYYNQAGTIAHTCTYNLPPSGANTFHTTPGSFCEPVGMSGVAGSLRVTCTSCGGGGPKIVGVMVETLFTSNIVGAYAGFKEY